MFRALLKFAWLSMSASVVDHVLSAFVVVRWHDYASLAELSSWKALTYFKGYLEWRIT